LLLLFLHFVRHLHHSATPGNFPAFAVLDLHGNHKPMKIAYQYPKYSATLLMSVALANGSSCFQSRAAEQTPVDLTERIRVLSAEDLGLLPIDQSRRFSSGIMTETSRAGLLLRSTSRVTSRTNGYFTELRQNLSLEATEPQLLDFLRNVATSNSVFRVQSLSLRPTPDRTRLGASMAIAGDYRLPDAGPAPDPAAAQLEYQVLSQRRHLRQAALDCYNVTKSTLPPGWQLDSLNFQDGKRLSLQGNAPAEQVRLLEDVRAGFEKAQPQEGKDLFSSGQATMQLTAPAMTNFSWSMQFALRPPESP
jgi:hypothetical protein